MKFRIITRPCTDSEWLRSSLHSKHKTTPGFFIYKKKPWWFGWEKLVMKDALNYAGYYDTKEKAEKDLGEYMIDILAGKNPDDNIVGEYNLNFDINELIRFTERNKDG